MDPVFRMSLPQGHIQNILDPLGVQARVHRPTDDASGKGIQNHEKVKEA